MGSEKRHLDEEAYWPMAAEMLVEYGFVRKCEMHGEYVDLLAGDLDEDAEQLNEMITEMRQNGFRGTDEQAVDALSSALRLAGEECESCAKNRDS